MKNQTMTAVLDHLNLTVRNFAESAAWYKSVFGFEVVEKGTEADGPWGVLRNGDSMLCIYESPTKQAARSESGEDLHQIRHFGLRIHDRQKWERILRENSIRPHFGGAVHYSHSISWYVTDPTGHMIEVALWNQDQVQF